MNIPVITWSLIVALFVSVLIFRLVVHLRNTYHFNTRQSAPTHHQLRRHWLSIGSEREELFIPGDPTGSEKYPPYARSEKIDYDEDSF